MLRNRRSAVSNYQKMRITFGWYPKYAWIFYRKWCMVMLSKGAVTSGLARLLAADFECSPLCVDEKSQKSLSLLVCDVS
jgi:hypothetical protein